jgi:hypothetical protein
VIQPDIHPLVFAIPTLLSLVVIVWLFGPLQREAWEEIKEETEALGADELSGAIEEQEEDEDDIQEKVMRLGWMTGQALWLACIPLAIVWAFSNSREVMPVLLALPSDQPSSVPSNFARLLNFGDPAIALAWGSLLGIIGAMGLALVLMFRARPSEIPEFVVDANGLVLGYGITIGVMWLSVPTFRHNG